MDRLIAPNSVASGAADAPPGTGTPQFATSGNPATSTPATDFPAYAFNAIQEELIAIIVGGGVTPSRFVAGQVLSAIQAIIKQSAVLTDTGTANAYAAVNPTPLTVGTLVHGVRQSVQFAHTNNGASTYAPDGLAVKPMYGLDLVALQGGEAPLNGIGNMIYYVNAAVNSGNGAWILLECTGGALQIPNATQPQHAVAFSQLPGVVGTMRNAKMSVTAASASATFTADEIVVESALGGLPYRLASYSQTINLATTGAGGMDTGTAPVSGFVALYAIYNPTTNTKSILATNAATLQGNVYGGANMPAGYTASALIGVWPTNPSSQFVVGLQIDRSFSFFGVVVLSTATANSSLTTLSVTGVPLNAKSVNGTLTIASTIAANFGMSVAASSTGIGQQNINAVNSGASQPIGGPFNGLALLTPQTIFWSMTGSGGTLSFQILVTGYSF